MDDTQGEFLWVKVSLKDNNPLYVGGFYRQPSEHTTVQIDDLAKSLDYVSNKMKKNPNSTIFLGGDFNAGDIDRESLSVTHSSSQCSICIRLLEVLGLYNLEQQQREATREKCILDLFCTNKPGLVKACYSIPALSDHDCDIKAQVSKKPPRRIFKWTKSNWDLIRSEVSKFKEKFLSEYTSRSVEDNYNEVSKYLESVTDQHVPSKISTSKSNTPWFNSTLKRMCRKKQRLFSHAKKSHKKAH